MVNKGKPRKKIEYALEQTHKIVKEFEKKYEMTSDEFLKRFQEGDLKENGDLFEWWAELKIAGELEENLRLVEKDKAK